mmetsp:Transcript_31955/g.51615  ORF Transcript_31955/g.51615 Transcript_31955/m.51615 type:complete len:479 (-) Transcript_31955:15-1451(-)
MSQNNDTMSYIPPAPLHVGRDESEESVLETAPLHIPVKQEVRDCRDWNLVRCAERQMLPRYQDPIFALLFLAQLAFVMFLSVHSGTRFFYGSSTPMLRDGSYSHIISGLLGCVAVSGIVSTVWLILVATLARMAVLFTMGLTVAALFGLMLFLFITTHWALGVVSLLGFLAQTWYFYCCRSRIEFATTTIQIAVSAIMSYKSLFFIAFASLLLTMGWMILWSLSALYTLQQADSGSVYVVGFLFLLSLYWTGQVINNVLHCTVAGTVGLWFFASEDQEEGQSCGLVGPVLDVLRRACTMSLGSICLGSLIVALLRSARVVIRLGKHVRNRPMQQVVESILIALEKAMAYFNSYAYTQIGLYGKPFVQAAHDTWNLMHERGIDAVLNDNIVSGLAGWGAVLGGGITAIIMGPVSYSTDTNDTYWVNMTMLAFLVGFVTVQQTMTVLESSVIALFVLFAEVSGLLLCHSLYTSFCPFSVE